MKQYDVTIGIPIYNSVSYIRASLTSALAQTYPSIEFLLVNDGCDDGTMEIVNFIIAEHSKGGDVRIISHSENQGVSASRNQIIDEAKGEYLYFMDSDDFIEANTIELLMDNARQYNAEIVFGSYEKIEPSGKCITCQYPSLQFLEKDGLASFAYRKYAGIQASACNYLVKTALLHHQQHHFIDTNYWEDFVFTSDLVTLVSRAVLLPDITYHYICRCNSLSHYQERIDISKEEVMQSVRANDFLKTTSGKLVDKSYFPNRCYQIAMTNFYIACTILKRRNAITPRFSNREIKTLMCHPVSWRQICSFRQARIKNMLLYMIGIMPSPLSVGMIWVMGKLKKLI